MKPILLACLLCTAGIHAGEFPQPLGNPLAPVWSLFVTAALEDGDEIAIFAGQRLVGAAVVSAGEARVKAWQELEDGPGYTPGESATILAWDASRNAILPLESADWIQDPSLHSSFTFPSEDGVISIATFSFGTPPDPPTLSTDSIRENLPAGTHIADIAPAGYQFRSAVPGLRIDNDRLLVDGPLDFESRPLIALPLAYRENGFDVPADLELQLLDRNDAPTALSLASDGAFEVVPGQIIGNLTVSDPDLDPIYRDYQFSVVGDGRFIVENGSLRLAPGQALLYAVEPSVTLSIAITDGDLPSLTFSFSFPVLPLHREQFEAARESAPNAQVGQLIGLPNAGTYSLPASSPIFSIDATSGMIRVSNPCALAADSATVYHLLVANNGQQAVAEIAVDRPNRAPIMADQAFSMAGGQVAAFDPDGDSLSFRILSGNADDVFTLTTEGVLTSTAIGPIRVLEVEVWDGTLASTASIAFRALQYGTLETAGTLSSPTMFVAIGGNLIYSLANELWQSDGSDTGAPIADESPSIWQVAHNALYFGRDNQLWRADRDGIQSITTLPGTLAAIHEAPDGQVYLELTGASGEARRHRRCSTRSNNRWLYSSDGTSAGTQPVYQMPSYSYNSCYGGSSAYLSSVNGIFLAQVSQSWSRAYGSRSTTTLLELADAGPVSLRYVSGFAQTVQGPHMLMLGSSILYAAQATLSNVHWAHQLNGRVVCGRTGELVAFSPVTGCLENIAVLQSGYQNFLGEAYGRLYFQLAGTIWASDGLTVTDLGIPGNFTFTASAGGFFFFGAGDRLWQTDGTVAGTREHFLSANLEQLAGSEDTLFAQVGTELQVFQGISADDAPSILGQDPIVGTGDTGIPINLDDLQISGSSPARAGIEIRLLGGENYTLDGNNVIPDANFAGVLRVPVQLLRDGEVIDEFAVRVRVVPPITGTVGFANSASTETERTGLAHVALVLTLDEGEQTIDAISATVGATVITFPAGSQHGAVSLLPVPLVADSASAGNETIDLQLTQVSGAGTWTLGSTTNHQLVVENAPQALHSGFIRYAGAAPGLPVAQIGGQTIEGPLSSFPGDWELALPSLSVGSHQLRVFADTNGNRQLDSGEATVLADIASNFDLTLVDPDEDEDGIPDYWELFHFETIDILPEDDPDADGLSNAIEFTYELDPNLAEALAERPTVSLTVVIEGQGQVNLASGDYALGTELALNATPALGWRLLGHEGELQLFAPGTVTVHFGDDPSYFLPVFQLDPEEVFLEVGSATPDLLDGLVASDETGADSRGDVVVTGNVNTGLLDAFEVLYNWRGQELERVYVVQDSTAPVITAEARTVEAGSAVDLLEGVSALDAVNGDLTADIEAIGSVEAGVTYTATDLSGNVGTTFRSYTIVDTTPPTLVIDPPLVAVGLGDEVNLLAGISTDGRLEVEGTVDPSVIGETIVNYRAIDLAGNQSSGTRTYQVGCAALDVTIETDYFVLGPPLVYSPVGDPRHFRLTGDLQIQPNGAQIQVSATCASQTEVTYTLTAVVDYQGDQDGQWLANGTPFDLAVQLPALSAGPQSLHIFLDTNANATADVWEPSLTRELHLQADAFLGRLAPVDPDRDRDGLPDWWEQLHWGHFFATGSQDSDNDGRDNGAEFANNSHPRHPDPPLSHTVTIVHSGDGSGSSDPAPGPYQVAHGSEFAISATPDSGSYVTGSHSRIVITPTTITIAFTRDPAYLLSVPAGWSRFAIPLDSFDDIGTLFGEAKLGPLLRWESSALQAVADDQSLLGYEVYTVFLSRSLELIIRGQEASPSPPEPGWNLTTAGSLGALPADTLLWHFHDGGYRATRPDAEPALSVVWYYQM